MKFFLLTLATFALAITALHAQTADPATDPVLQAMGSLIPPAYAAYFSLAVNLWMVLGRAFTALKSNGGLKGIYNAVVNGVTLKALIAVLALSTLLTACDTPKTAAEAAKRQRYAALGDKLLTLGLARGYVTQAEATEIRDLGAIILPTTAPAVEVTSGK